MKTDLETQLLSWELRRPSPKVESAIFSPQTSDRQARETRGGWLVPAMAAAIVVVTVFNHRNIVTYEPIQVTGSVAALMLSNRSPSTPTPAGSIQLRNSLTGDSFRWTNAGNFSTSSISSILGTNL